jgi:hypothetical protein
MKADLEFAVANVPWATDKGDVNKGACYHLLAKINLSLGLFDDAITAATAVISQGTYKLMTTRFGVDAGVTTKNVTWDLHRPENKSAATNTEALFIVTDRLGVANNFAGGIQTMRNACPGYSIAGIRTPAGGTGMVALASHFLPTGSNLIICRSLAVVSDVAAQPRITTMISGMMQKTTGTILFQVTGCIWKT